VQRRELQRIAIGVQQFRPVCALGRLQRGVQPEVGDEKGAQPKRHVGRERAGQPLRIRIDAELARDHGHVSGRLVAGTSKRGQQRSRVSLSRARRMPLIPVRSRSGIRRVAMRSHGRRPWEPLFSQTRTGSPSRIRSRSSMDSPGTSPLTS